MMKPKKYRELAAGYAYVTTVYDMAYGRYDILVWYAITAMVYTLNVLKHYAPLKSQTLKHCIASI